MMLFCLLGHYCSIGSHEPIRCLSGTYQDETAQALCKTCPAGFFCDNTFAPVVLFNDSHCPEGGIFILSPCYFVTMLFCHHVISFPSQWLNTWSVWCVCASTLTCKHMHARTHTCTHTHAHTHIYTYIHTIQTEFHWTQLITILKIYIIICEHVCMHVRSYLQTSL